MGGGRGRWGGKGRGKKERANTKHYTVTTMPIDFCVKIGSDASHFHHHVRAQLNHTHREEISSGKRQVLTWTHLAIYRTHSKHTPTPSICRHKPAPCTTFSKNKQNQTNTKHTWFQTTPGWQQTDILYKITAICHETFCTCHSFILKKMVHTLFILCS